MPANDVNLADRPGSLLESHKNYDPRLVLFYFVVAALLVVLAAGLGYQQLGKVGDYADAEWQQNHRRVLIPGPRGNIYDRNQKILVGNKHRFDVLLHLDELKAELMDEARRIRKNYRETGDKDVPSWTQMQHIARVSLVQRYLDQVNAILGRQDKVDARRLQAHFRGRLLLPYTLIENLAPEEFARLVERLPVRSPLEVYAFNVRTYPYGSAAAHTLGYVRMDLDLEAENFPGPELMTFKMTGASGRDGLEKSFDEHLQGEAGGHIFRVDPSGFKIKPAVETRTPKQGRHLVTSLDIDLQLAAEEAIGDRIGAAVALDVTTGEVLVLASKPDYDLNEFSPRATQAVVDRMNERGAWNNLALNGSLPPGSTFKIMTSIAGLRRDVLTPDKPIEHCNRSLRIGGRNFPCYNYKEAHGDVLLRDAIAHSCDIYYYRLGLTLTPDVLAAEARRMHFGQPTGIELPGEVGPFLVPDTEWMRRTRGSRWYDGETANVSIGQGALLVTPLQMACFAASLARDDVYTVPTLIHRPDRPAQRHGRIGLTPEERDAILDGMVGCVEEGTARTIVQVPALRVPVSVAGKTGTAQIAQQKNVAWFIAFAPREKPEIAIAVALVGEVSGEEYGGGRYAAPVAAAVLKKYFGKKLPAPKPAARTAKTE